MNKNTCCLNTIDDGAIWGEFSTYVEINKIAKNQKDKVEYLGNYMTWDSDTVYAVFHTAERNYFVAID